MGVFSGFKRNEPEKSIIKRHHSLKGTKLEKIDEAEDRAKSLLDDGKFINWIYDEFGGNSAQITISLGVKTQGLHMIVLDLKKAHESDYEAYESGSMFEGTLKTIHIKEVDYIFLDGVVDWDNFEFHKEYLVENKNRHYITVDSSLAGVDEEKIKEAQRRSKVLLSHGLEFEKMVSSNTYYDPDDYGKTTVSLDIATQRNYYLCLECTMYQGSFAGHKIVSRPKNKIDVISPEDFEWKMGPKDNTYLI